MRLGPGGALSDPPEGAGPSVEDWGIALALSLFPIVGLGLGRGDALTLFGVATIVAVATRLPARGSLRDAALASGVCVLLVLFCLLIPSAVEAAGVDGLAGGALEGAVRLLLAGVVGCALLRRTRLGAVRGPDWAAIAAGAVGVVVVGVLYLSGTAAAAHALAGLLISLGLVFGIYRLHLCRSSTLPLLARTGAAGVFGAVLVVLIRGVAA